MDVNVFDIVTINEDLNLESLIESTPFDSLAIVESFDNYLDNLFVSIYEDIPVTEWAKAHDIIIEEGINIDNISVAENVSIPAPIFDFGSFLRGLPFVEITHTGFSHIEYSTGVQQIIDNWGKNKRQFNITFPVSYKASALEIRDFYNDNAGEDFHFRNPLDNIVYTVQFLPNSYRVERSHYTTYFATVGLIEVF